MKRWVFLLYGVGCHLLFLAIFAGLCGFVGNFLMPRTIDVTPPAPPALAMAINLSLLVLFALQHSVMARPAFKRVWTRLIPAPIERSTYVLASCLATALLMWQWRAIDIVLWNVQAPSLRGALWFLFGVGWLAVPLVTLLIDHFDLVGTRQVWLYFQGRPYESLPFREPMLYRNVRHPLYVGWMMAFWMTPTMTVGHALFAAIMTFYMAAAALLEERDLIAHFGEAYRNYRTRVPMFIPRMSARNITPAAATADTADVPMIP